MVKQYLIKSWLQVIFNGIYKGGLEFILSVPCLGGFVTIISTLLPLIQFPLPLHLRMSLLVES